MLDCYTMSLKSSKIDFMLKSYEVVVLGGCVDYRFSVSAPGPRSLLGLGWGWD